MARLLFFFFLLLIKPIKKMKQIKRQRTRTLAVRDLEGPLVDRTLRATSAAACSACLNVVQ